MHVYIYIFICRQFLATSAEVTPSGGCMALIQGQGIDLYLIKLLSIFRIDQVLTVGLPKGKAPDPSLKWS